jgi:CheY-like chemotaxis protein
LEGVPILIVDANASHRQILQHYALTWKMKTDAVASGSKALELLRLSARGPAPYRLLILDMADDAEALAFALKVKSEDSPAGLRVVAVTAAGKPLDAEVRRAAGIAVAVSKPVREGALFNALSNALSGDPRAAASSPPSAPRAGRRYFRILMVEDNPVNQRVAQMQLAKLGYAADIVAGGEEALQSLSEHTYDLIFMDCQMPGMDGFEATAEVRKREGGEHRVPIVAMTANALEGDRKKCLAAGMDDYLSKPVDLKKLTDILLRWDVTLDASVIRSLRDLAGEETKLVRDVIEQFLKDSPKRVETIFRAAKEENARELEKAAHALKGASGNIGAKALWAVCEKIEDLARSNELKEAAGPLGVLQEEFDKLRVDLEKEKEK